MQPTDIPWLGYFDLIDSVDKFVFLDDVKLEKCSWHVRNRIRSSNGEIYLTIPIRKTIERDKLKINEAQINDAINWRQKHLKSIFFAYRKANFFDEIYFFVQELINTKTDKLKDFNIGIITALLNRMGINTCIVRTSEMLNLEGVSDKRIVSICKSIGCDEYVSPPGAACYIEKDFPGGAIVANNIALYYHKYQHPSYTQLYDGFLPYMSIVDLLFNYGYDESLNIIRSGR
ncbi:MAG: WbqC family protein [Gammaproteobacteria bacterium]